MICHDMPIYIILSGEHPHEISQPVAGQPTLRGLSQGFKVCLDRTLGHLAQGGIEGAGLAQVEARVRAPEGHGKDLEVSILRVFGSI